MSDLDPDAAADTLVTQAATLFEVEDDLSRVIGNLDLPDDMQDGYRVKNSKTFGFEPMFRLLLYKELTQYSQNQLADRIRHWPYLRMRFDLERSPTQQAISYTENRRFTMNQRRLIREVAAGIREAVQDLDLQQPGFDLNAEPDPDEIADSQIPLHHYVDEHAPDLIKTGQEKIFTAFDTGRAHNITHEDEKVWEHQTAMSLQFRSGTRAAYRTFNKFRFNALHGDTHTRAVKKLGKPTVEQHTLDEYIASNEEVPYWRRVADTVFDQFDDAIDLLLDEVVPTDYFTQPVAVAIDTTMDPFHVSPWKSEDDIEPDDKRIPVGNRLKVPKEDYPEMVHGSEKEDVRGYEYATLTIIGRGVPIVIAVEPIRKSSQWEDGEGTTVSFAEAVDRLLTRAQKHLDIHLVMADRQFDSNAVFHVIGQKHGLNYLIPKKNNAAALTKNKQEVEEDPLINSRVVKGCSVKLDRDSPYVDLHSDPDIDEDGISHEASCLYVPAYSDDFAMDDDGNFAIFVTNREDISPMDAIGLTGRYSHRWDSEMGFRMIKPLLPSIASTDYRMRAFAFAFSVLLYNLWRMVDHKLKDLAAEEYEDYGRDPHGERLDPVVPFSDLVLTYLLMAMDDGLDPPDHEDL
jgi:hypothetical protein